MKRIGKCLKKHNPKGRAWNTIRKLIQDKTHVQRRKDRSAKQKLASEKEEIKALGPRMLREKPKGSRGWHLVKTSVADRKLLLAVGDRMYVQNGKKKKRTTRQMVLDKAGVDMNELGKANCFELCPIEPKKSQAGASKSRKNPKKS